MRLKPKLVLNAMVRRRSTVRVHQRGLQKSPHAGLFGLTCRSSNVGQIWSPLWSRQVEGVSEECTGLRTVPSGGAALNLASPVERAPADHVRRCAQQPILST